MPLACPAGGDDSSDDDDEAEPIALPASAAAWEARAVELLRRDGRCPDWLVDWVRQGMKAAMLPALGLQLRAWVPKGARASRCRPGCDNMGVTICI